MTLQDMVREADPDRILVVCNPLLLVGFSAETSICVYILTMEPRR